MRIELTYDCGKVDIRGKVDIQAIDDSEPDLEYRVVARGKGDTLEEAVKALVSRFAELQSETIDALAASGLIRLDTASKPDNEE